jgi:Spy/CpxP family protein refolding chaperone
MNRIKSFFVITAFLTVSLIYFSACSDKGDVNTPNQLNFDSPQFALVDFTDVTNGVEDATFDSEMTFNSTLFNYSFINTITAMTPGNPRLAGNPWMEHFDFGKNFGIFFRGLNLTDAQKTQLKDLMVKFHESMKPLVQQFKDANAQIVADANVARKGILDQVKAGTLSRADAETQLKALNMATRDKINANPATITIKAQMCDARTKLIADVKAVLNADQNVKFDALLKLIKNPC